MDAAFFSRPAAAVAPDLLGRWLWRTFAPGEAPVVVRITEVEAYVWPDDSANHCFRGRTPRNAAMFGPPGRAYVYRCYGLHHLLNLVTDGEGEGAAVLIRAVEPVRGHAALAARRGGRAGPDSLAGPGKVCAGLALDLGFNHHPVCAPGPLEVRAGVPVAQVRRGPRVGIDYARPEDRAAPLRFAAADTRWISQPRTLGAPAPHLPLEPTSSR